MGLSPPLQYPLPTTHQEVHQIRTLICEILVAACARRQASPRKFPAYTTPDERAAASGHVRRHNAREPSPQFLPLSRHSPFSGPHTPTIARSHGPRDTGLPLCPITHTCPPQTLPPNEPHHPPQRATHTHPPRRATRLTALPPRPVTHTRPPHAPPKPQAQPPWPLNAADASCSPPPTPTRTPSLIAGAQPSQTRKEETAAPRLPRQPPPTRLACRATRSRLGPSSHPPPSRSPRRCPPSSPQWPPRRPPRLTKPPLPAWRRNPHPP